MLYNQQTVSDIWDLEMCHYGHLYYDNDGITAEQRCYTHNISYEEVSDFLKYEPVFIVNEDRFLRKKE